MPELDPAARWLWVTSSPFPDLPQVGLRHERWTDHIVGRAGHPELLGKDENLRLVVSQATAVFPGHAGTGNVIFMNATQVTKSGIPLIVVVSARTAEVVTALYDRRYSVLREEDRLWSF